MNVIRVRQLSYVRTGWGVKGRPIIDMPEVGIVNLVLEPGEKVPSHKTPVDVLFQVVEGKGTVTIGDETQVVEAGDIVVSPLQIPHALEDAAGLPRSLVRIQHEAVDVIAQAL